MTVELLHHTPLWVADAAIGKCWDTGRYSGHKMKERIHRVGNKHKHASTLEHLVYNFDIDGISRACLQELARHRIASLSVKSTRYTLKELRQSTSLEDFLVPTGNEEIDAHNWFVLRELKMLMNEGKITNDIAKFMLPEAYKTSLVWSINARSLQNFIQLRTNKAAMWEIRKLAFKVFSEIPEDHKYLFEEFVYDPTPTTETSPS